MTEGKTPLHTLEDRQTDEANPTVKTVDNESHGAYIIIAAHSTQNCLIGELGLCFSRVIKYMQQDILY